MKVIELLNKIANEEPVPTTIFKKWEYEWKYDDAKKEYTYFTKDGGRFDEDWFILSILDEEIETSMDKENIKIELIEQRTDTGLFGSMINNEIKVAEAINKQANYLSDIVNKVNEIIVVINDNK